LVSKEKKLIKSLKPRPQIKTPVATNMFIPNHSGITDHPEFKYNTKHIDFTIINPSGTYDNDTQIFIMWAKVDLIITNIQIELDISTQEVAGDLKYADDFQALGNATVIQAFDTTSGKSNNTLDSSVASGKAIYLQFDNQPNTAINQMHVHIQYK